MDPKLMTESHQTAAPWAWGLGPREAATLAPAPVPRWLRVDTGRLWVTARDGGPAQPDLWLEPGDGLLLPPGSAWIVEAWPSARASILEAAPRRFSDGAWRAAWRALPARLAARFVPMAA